MEKQEVKVDIQTMISLRMMEFDKKIATEESKVAELKRQRADVLYELTVQQAMATHG